MKILIFRTFPRRKNSLLGDIMEKRRKRPPGGPANKNLKMSVPIIVDLAFASNVRFLDDHELHLDNVELYKVILIKS